MLRGFITFAVVCALALPTSAQDLDGVWFKLKVKSKGFTVENQFPTAEGVPSQVLEKASFKTTAWMLLEYAETEGGGGAPVYMATIVTEVDDDVYDIANIDTFDVLADRLLINGFLGFVTPDGAVGSDCTLEAKVKLDKEDAFKSGKIKALGANVTDSALVPPGFEEGGIAYFGGMTIKGSSVSLTKLPFDPEVVLEGGGMLAKLAAPGLPWVFGADAVNRETSTR